MLRTLNQRDVIKARVDSTGLVSAKLIYELNFFIFSDVSDNKLITVKMTREFDRIHMTEVGSFGGGRLEIRVRCTGPYSLQVTGRSTLDFTYQLSLVDNINTGETRPLLGSPVKGIKDHFYSGKILLVVLSYRKIGCSHATEDLTFFVPFQNLDLSPYLSIKPIALKIADNRKTVIILFPLASYERGNLRMYT